MMMMRKEDIFPLSRSPHVSWDGGEQVCLCKTEKGPSEKEGGGKLRQLENTRKGGKESGN